MLSSAHERLRQRCDRRKILLALEDKYAAYDAHGVHSLLARKYDAVEEQLESSEAAPSTFVASLWRLVQPAESQAPEDDKAAAADVPQTAEHPTTPAPAPSKPRALTQPSVGTFFGKGVVKTYETLPSGGRILSSVSNMTDEQLRAMPTTTAGLCSKGCGQAFPHAPAKVAHEKVCKGGTNTTANAAAADAQAAAALAALAGVSAEAASSSSAAATTAAGDSDDELAPPPAKVPKLRKSDGKPKQSGQRQGAKRTPRTLYFKLEVVKTFRRLERLKASAPFPIRRRVRCSRASSRATSPSTSRRRRSCESTSRTSTALRGSIRTGWARWPPSRLAAHTTPRALDRCGRQHVGWVVMPVGSRARPGALRGSSSRFGPLCEDLQVPRDSLVSDTSSSRLSSRASSIGIISKSRQEQRLRLRGVECWRYATIGAPSSV